MYYILLQIVFSSSTAQNNFSLQCLWKFTHTLSTERNFSSHGGVCGKCSFSSHQSTVGL